MQRLNFHHSFAHCGQNSKNYRSNYPFKLEIAFRTYLHREGSFELKISQKSFLAFQGIFSLIHLTILTTVHEEKRRKRRAFVVFCCDDDNNSSCSSM